MKVFVTGATGFIGSAIVTELIANGHQVLGLTRSESGAAALLAAGAEVHFGDLEDIDSLREGAAKSDGIIHTAFNHDFSKFKDSTENDRKIIEALGNELLGSNRPLIVTSGIGIIRTEGKLITEDDRAKNSANPRVATEEAVDAVAAKGVRVAVVRLPPSVHDNGDHGFIPMLINIAKEKGISAYKNEGNNRWPAVHRLDAARLFRLALEKNAEPGTRFHAVGDEGVLFRDIAAVVGKRLNIPVESKTAEDADAYFGWFAHFAAMDCPASYEQTRKMLGWTAQHPDLLADIDREGYFDTIFKKQ
ncbi:3-beta hydroxysteroid dehydrogenase [Flavobacterium noncentrifugens]|uniref:Nucleoside-diphosphate-sugar epimerase n=1 Tax=Flavobacterium noncentrifugens TaxID=1128970 RepID=A0A1G8WQK6_9FLAO|nr:SDR family oxidoreductase [Flavobacterium noncentrifugens]GEP51023.1 3-beta hydroxysteroid dehydrogenase [Flavobacterium noncentrifugens]SDJ80659.1 Nucleoside-diphosphate-sugar epimerase [Flavobacterium noncentrifugens]